MGPTGVYVPYLHPTRDAARRPEEVALLKELRDFLVGEDEDVPQDGI